MEHTNNKSFALWLGILIGGSMLLAASIFAFTFYRIRTSDNALTVTGSATEAVESDTVRWTGSFTRTVKLSALKSGYDQMTKDLALIKTFLAAQGVDDTQVTVSTVFMNQDYSNVNQNVSASEREYVLNQTIEVNSNEVVKITDIAKNTGDLINQGVIFSSNPVEYYYSKLPEARIRLLSSAVQDAKARASSLAASTGKRVGSLKSASSGVVQVLSPNSIEISDYGSYDTSNMKKQVMVTVKASFSLY